MKTIFFEKIGLGAHIKAVLKLSFTVGLIIGFYMFILSILGQPTTIILGTLKLTDLLAEIFSLLYLSLLFLILGFAFALITYFPTQLILKLLKKAKILGDLKEEDADE